MSFKGFREHVTKHILSLGIYEISRKNWKSSNTQVKAHMTHHVEAIIVDYDADMVSYVDLCKLFFEIHDPSQTDGIGPDLSRSWRWQLPRARLSDPSGFGAASGAAFRHGSRKRFLRR